MYKKIIISILVLTCVIITYSVCENNYYNSKLQKTNLNKNSSTIHNSYDVIVVGTDPEGIAAAISASRAGGKVLLIDNREEVGGLFTLGWLNFLDMNYGKNKVLLTRGIFKEFFSEVEGYAFSIETAKKAFLNMLHKEKFIDIKLGASNITPIVKEQNINGITAIYKNKQQSFYANAVIDATQNGDLAALAGANHSLGQSSIGGPEYGMAVTQVFCLKGMNKKQWNKLCKYLKSDDDAHSNSNKNTAWGFKNFTNIYKPKQKDIELRGLNLAREPSGRIMVNALKIFKINPLDKHSLAEAKQKALAELEHVIPFLRAKVPYMKDIELDTLAPELYIRESRHFNTLYTLTIDDVLENRDFNDKIAIGSYPVDIQGTAPNVGSLIVGLPDQYAIPIRSLVPVNIENLFIVGRCAGFDPIAHGSARVVPVGMCTGQAAGEAAMLLNKYKITNKELCDNKEFVNELQSNLVTNGAYLKSFKIEPTVLNNEFYTGLKFLRKYGLISGGYNNNYGLEKSYKNINFYWLFSNVSKRLSWSIINDFKQAKAEELLTFNHVLYNLSTHKELCNYLKSTDMFSSLDPNQPLTKGHVTMVIYHCNQFLKEQTSK